jgi:hypothetical protein
LAAALASGGEAYFLALLRLRDSLSAERVERVAALLDRYGRDWRARFQVVATEDLPLPVTELSGAWSALETELRRVCETCILSPHAGHE